jgi:GNAT superfamily N-acetyltransferase
MRMQGASFCAANPPRSALVYGVTTSSLVAIKRLSSASEDEFYRVHAGGPCQCVAWWVPSWDGWSERAPSENAALRRHLFEANVHDGYLIYRGGALAGWCQAWKRDAFAKLTALFEATSDEDAWMIGCLVVLPAFRRQGVATEALEMILDDLRLRGARSVDAYPKRGAADADELWNGPESTYARLGFAVVRDDAKRPVMRLSF